MPLPQDSRTAWPPRAYDDVTPTLEKWSAWYSGDPAQLMAAYGSGARPAFASDRPKGVLAAIRGVNELPKVIRRYFWGTGRPDGDQETKLHIPVAGDIAAMSADLLFGEVPDLVLEDDQAGLDRLNDYVEDGLWTRIREGAEIQAGLGGVFLRAVWDEEIAEVPWLQPMPPDVAVPEWSYDRLTAVTFWRVVEREPNRVVRHLERHERGAILHGLYEGTPRELGDLIALDATEDPEMRAIAEAVGPTGIVETGIPFLTAEYIPNVRPNRLWRAIPEAANLGRSDYQGVEGPMDSLDEVWTSWMRDIRLGKAKIILDQSALTGTGDGGPASFNIDKELLVGLNLTGNLDRDPISQVQFAIRTEDHANAAQATLEQIVRGAGYSMQTFSGETEGGAQTATETRAKEKRTLSTRDRKIEYWGLGLRRSLRMLLAIDGQIFGGSFGDEMPKIEFPDAVSEAPSEVATTIQALDAAKAISVKTKIQMLHPDWDDDRIEAEIEDIEGASRLANEADALTKLGQAAALGAVSEADVQTTAQARLARRNAGRSPGPAGRGAQE